jgi:hypothetical protein
VVADAEVLTPSVRKRHPAIRYPETNPWTLDLVSERVYLDSPVVIDAALRAKLDAFKGRDPSKQWAWFVQSTHGISKDDFEILTRHIEP